MRPFIRLAAVSLVLAAAAFAQSEPKSALPYAENEVLVRFRPSVSASQAQASHKNTGARVLRTYRQLGGLQRLQLPQGVTVQDAILEYRKDPNVLYAEPNYRLHVDAIPNDSRYSELWGMKKIGAEQAWDTTTGDPNVVVAVIDTGIDYSHPDLAANIWSNPADCDNDGTDDDANGFADDCHGIDMVNQDSDPMDDHFHGTHVAGTIGAVGNNGVGVAGVSWNVKMIGCKFLDASGSGWLADAVVCLDYLATLKDMGVNIVASNNSWGSTTFNPVLYASQTLRDAIHLQMEKGILFVVAATNGGPDRRGDNNDFSSPAAMVSLTELPNVISVAAIDSAGKLAVFSNYGRHSVHLAAPGVGVLSTVPTFNDASGYHAYNGTSMATPHVAGAVGLLKAANPALTWHELRNLLLTGAARAPEVASTVAQGVLNLPGSLSCSDSALLERTRPLSNNSTVAQGGTVILEMLHVRCGQPNGAVSVIADGVTIELKDDGIGPDAFAGDGVYAGQWNAPGAGSYLIEFPNGDDAVIQVLRPYTFASVAATPRQITGTNLNFTQQPFQVKEFDSPFPVQFGGGSFTTVFVAAGGTISFGAPFAELWSYPLPYSMGHNIVAPFWDFLIPVEQPPNSPQNVFWEVIGTAPHRELVVEWRNVSSAASANRTTETVRFQVVLFEDRPDVLFIYPDVTFGGQVSLQDGAGRGTVGIQTSPVDAVQFSHRRSSLHDGDALLWTLSQPADLTAPVISAISPQSVIQGTTDRTITVTGKNFGPDSIVRLFGWGDPPPVMSSTVVSNTEVSFVVPGQYLWLEGAVGFSVTVPDKGESNLVYLGIAPSPTAPRISSVSPSKISGGSTAPVTIRIMGQRFTAQSKIEFGFSTRPATFISANELRFTLSPAETANAGPYSIRVINDPEYSNFSGLIITEYQVANIGFPDAVVKQGGAGKYVLMVSSVWGSFTNPVTMSCSGLPTGASCQFSKSTLNSVDQEFVDLSISTTAPSTSSAAATQSSHSWALALLVGTFFVVGLMIPASFRRRAATALVLAMAFFLAACGGGSSSFTEPPPPPPPPASTTTPVGTYTVTITATSGSLTRTATAVLKVDPM